MRQLIVGLVAVVCACDDPGDGGAQQAEFVPPTGAAVGVEYCEAANRQDCRLVSAPCTDDGFATYAECIAAPAYDCTTEAAQTNDWGPCLRALDRECESLTEAEVRIGRYDTA